MNNQLDLGLANLQATNEPVECLGKTFESDEARRAYFVEMLRERLQDPGFRMTPGFPNGSDDEILQLSDPPYYTACPNPWLKELVQDNTDGSTNYHRDPITADIKENKHHPIYTAHSYHTKVPHRAIMRYILHFTEPGDCILDAFSGTGMTGVAAQLCGDRSEIESLGYQVRQDGVILDENGKPFSKLGPRRAILNDLAPAASFLSHWYNACGRTAEYEKIAKRVLATVASQLDWMFHTLHAPSKEEIQEAVEQITSSTTPSFSEGKRGRINYVVWSQVFACSHCGSDVVFWDAAVDKENGAVRDTFPCPSCNSSLTKRGLEPAFETVFDRYLNSAHRRAKSVPVQIHYTFAGKRYEKLPDVADFALLDKIADTQIEQWFPRDRMPKGIETRRNDSVGITHFHHFYTDRNLAVLAAAWALLPQSHKWIVTGCLHRGSKQHQIAITRIGGEKAGEGGATAGHRRGTLYVPSNQVEMNGLQLLSDRADAISKACRQIPSTGGVFVSTQSASSLDLPDNSIDYFFFDPPFGANIAYSELNSTTEAWLGVRTNIAMEAIEDRAQKKGISEYKALITDCFARVYRALKPGRWMTVEFSNTQASVWNAIQLALQEAGFVVANVSALSKGRGGLMSIVGVTAVKQDLVISAYKPSAEIEERLSLIHDPEEGVWPFVRNHLRNLPVILLRGEAVEFCAERDPRILYDRLVAFYVGRSKPVPMGSSEFREGVAARFPEREGMFFLPEQVIEYDQKRTSVGALRQLSLFVNDEQSAIQWVRQQLQDKPQSFQDLQPQFMRELQAWAKHEETVELKTILEQNFLYYEGRSPVPSQIHRYLSSNYKDLRNLEKDDLRLIEKARDRWFVPDTNKQTDLEQLREKLLLKEFEEYKTSTQRKLKVFRTEAVRVGFKACWQERDYGTVVKVAEKLPDTVLQEDEKLLMYYDNALTRLGDD